MRFLYVLPLVLLTACPELVVRFVSGGGDDTAVPDPDTGGGFVDDDGDGFSVEDGDCDDTNPAVYPGAPEGTPGAFGGGDGIDNDCDGEVDERDTGGGGIDTGRDSGKDTGRDSGGGWIDTGKDTGRDTGGGGGIDTGRDTGKDTGRDTGGGGGGFGAEFTDDDGDGYSEMKGDCDDADATIYPGAKDTPGDKIDSDCDRVY